MTDAEFVREIARPLSGGPGDYDPLLELIGDARFVLLGEATHGTHEFYSERAMITKRLIAEKGFSIVAIEADWPDSSGVHRYVRDGTAGANADELFHETGLPRFWIDLRGAGQIGVLQQRRIERAIGVIYRPESERLSHYFHARLPEQFDAIIHIDETRAVEPLERSGVWEEGELPETYPFKV